MGVGEAPRRSLLNPDAGARGQLPVATLLVLLVLLLATSAHAQCRILKCNSEFVAATSGPGRSTVEDGGGAAAVGPVGPVGPIGRGRPSPGSAAPLCAALRAYSACTRRTSRACRGDLAYHSAVLGIEDLMAQNACGGTSAVAAGGGRLASSERSPAPPPPAPPARAGPVRRACGATRARAPPAGAYRYCGLSGDPHVRTFPGGMHACRVAGAWPLVDNEHVYVQATSVPVYGGATATATSKLTIIFKGQQHCTDERVYHAETDDLPAAFVDGTKMGGLGGRQYAASGLLVTEKVPGRHVEISAVYIGTTVAVRQVGRYLTFAIRTPARVAEAYDHDESLGQALQLCWRGCPGTERLDQEAGGAGGSGGDGRTAGVFTARTARAACEERLSVDDPYFETCVFDLLTTGDLSFARAAAFASQDAVELAPPLAVASGRERQGGGAGAPRPSAPVVAALALAAVVLMAVGGSPNS
ncbi:hemojuvelin-like [Lethenteron reissneri]|uniref:hemojuvelin-like n=1 Tax=Lethenteron reissneri TaxID=7753 RepID=UPI002AB5E737|nr:hemojuvelin-like [Lethenteron reissneri]